MEVSVRGVQGDRLYDGKEDVRPSWKNSGHCQIGGIVSWLEIRQT
jgi:hypothetical protein